MKLISMLLLVMILTGCTTAHLNQNKTEWSKAQALHYELFSKFTLIDQSKKDKVIMWTGYEAKFSGDCDDYVTAAVSRMRDLSWPIRVVYAEHKKSKERHIMACRLFAKNRATCLDNTHRNVTTWREVKREYSILKILDKV